MHPHDTSEGSEFPDDSLRPEDLPSTMADLQKKGYTADLSFETDTFELYGGDLDMRLDPEDFHIDEIDRIGTDDQPSEGKVVYAVSTSTGIKGTIIE
jgi:hypothetical protein